VVNPKPDQAIITAIPRPAAPRDLNRAQAAEWNSVVERMPADWFPRETHALLAQYCRHVITARQIAGMIDSLMKGDSQSNSWLDDYDRLLKMQEREGRAMSSLATRMRISQQAQYNQNKNPGTTVTKPWET